MVGLRYRRGNLYSSLPIPLVLALILTLFAASPENVSSDSNESNISEFVPVEDVLNITENSTPADNGTSDEFIDVDEFLWTNETSGEENLAEDVIIPEENETQEIISPEENITEEIPPEEFIPVDEFLNQTNTTQEEVDDEPLEPELESTIASLSEESYSLSGDYVEAGATEIYPEEGSFSAQAWVRTSDTSDGIILSTGEYGTVEQYWSMGKSWSGDLAPLYIRLNDGSDGEIFGYGTKNLADGKWHYVVFVRDRIEKKVLGYVDGELDLEFNDTTDGIIDKNSELMLGNSNPNQDEWFVGEITGFGTFSEAFTTEEVRALYSAQAADYGEDG